MQFSAQDLMEKIIELRIQLDYQIVELSLHEAADNIQFNAKQLISTFEQLKYDYPEDFLNFIEENSKYKLLNAISHDNAQGLQQIISCITKDTEQTVASIVKQVQTHKFHQWVKKIQNKILHKILPKYVK
jgi:Mg/Co/Ni transporter MgtE